MKTRLFSFFPKKQGGLAREEKVAVKQEKTNSSTVQTPNLFYGRLLEKFNLQNAIQGNKLFSAFEANSRYQQVFYENPALVEEAVTIRGFGSHGIKTVFKKAEILALKDDEHSLMRNAFIEKLKLVLKHENRYVGLVKLSKNSFVLFPANELAYPDYFQYSEAIKSINIENTPVVILYQRTSDNKLASYSGFIRENTTTPEEYLVLESADTVRRLLKKNVLNLAEISLEEFQMSFELTVLTVAEELDSARNQDNYETEAVETVYFNYSNLTPLSVLAAKELEAEKEKLLALSKEIKRNYARMKSSFALIEAFEWGTRDDELESLLSTPIDAQNSYLVNKKAIVTLLTDESGE